MRILITGTEGLVGSAIKEWGRSDESLKLETTRTCGNVFYFAKRLDGDLTKEKNVVALYELFKPDYVIHCAAFVGGVGIHQTHPGKLFYNNLMMNSLMIHYAMEYKVKKLLMFSSVCAMPDGLPVLKEELMHAGEPPIQNREYGYAKRMIDLHIDSYKKEYGIKNYCSIIPSNIFGKYDNFNLQTGHVLPSLIHKMYLAKKKNEPFRVWGDGSSKREMIYSADVAKFLMQILELDTIPSRIIMAGNKQYSIKELVEMLCKVAGYNGEVIWETDKPNGQHARPSDTSLLQSLIDVKYTDMETALSNSYHWFEQNYPNMRM